MELMPRGAVPVVLLVGLLGGWAGAGVSAVPPTPTISLPTVTVPPLPVPLPSPAPPAPAPPTETAPPPPLEPPPLPPAPAVDAPVASSPSTLSSRRVSALRGRAASRVYSARKVPSDRPQASRAHTRLTETRTSDRKVSASIARRAAPHVQDASAAVQGRVPEEGRFLAPIAAALNPVDSAREAIPGALFAMALLAILLLTLASMPPPLRHSRAGAMLVHKRGSIALAGGAALVTALGTYFLL